MKRILFLFILVILFILNIKIVNANLMRNESNMPNFELINSSITRSQSGTYEFDMTVKNSGDLVTTGTVPIHWAELYYEL